MRYIIILYCLFLCVYCTKLVIVEELFSEEAWSELELLCRTEHTCSILPKSMTQYLTEVHAAHDRTFSRFRVEYLCRLKHCDSLDVIAEELYSYDAVMIDTKYFTSPHPLTQLLGYLTLLYPMRGPQLLPTITLPFVNQLNREHRQYQAKKYSTLLSTAQVLRNADSITDSILTSIASSHYKAYDNFTAEIDSSSCLAPLLPIALSVSSVPIQSYSQQRLLCLIYSTSSRTAAMHSILQTWGHKCHGILFFSNSTDLDNNIVHLASPDNIPDHYDNMWHKSQLILNTVAESSLLSTYDYFLMGGDDLYVVVENLHALLSTFPNADLPLYIGRTIYQNKLLAFNTGGAGYVLNKKALVVLHELLNHSPSCLTNITTTMEDVMVAQCLAFGGVLPSVYDKSDGEVFHPLSPVEAYGGDVDWYQEMVPDALRGASCCSQRSVSFQNIKTAKNMLCLHAEVYNSYKNN